MVSQKVGYGEMRSSGSGSELVVSTFPSFGEPVGAAPI